MGNLFNNAEQVLLLSNILNFTFCFVILIYVRWMLQKKTVSVSRRAFKRLVIFIIACLASDMLSYVFDMHAGAVFKALNHVAMFFAVFLTAFVGFLWNDLFDQLLHIKRRKKERMLCHIGWLLPAAAAVIVLIVNLFTGIIYKIDNENVYHRGTYYVISFFIQYVSFAILGVRAALIKGKAKNMPLKRTKLSRTVFCLCAVVLSFGMVQWITNGKIAVHCMGMTAGVILVFMRFLDTQITQDRLTDLNNRYALDAHMINRINMYDNGRLTSKLYFVMMDVDGFKEINDKFGHLEGDNALRCLASSLKNVSGKYHRGFFVARYGGDEFAAVIESESPNAVETFEKQMKKELKKHAHSHRHKYKLSVSIGYSEYVGGLSPSEWIQMADEDLYRNKHSVKDTVKK